MTGIFRKINEMLDNINYVHKPHYKGTNFGVTLGEQHISYNMQANLESKSIKKQQSCLAKMLKTKTKQKEKKKIKLKEINHKILSEANQLRKHKPNSNAKNH